jgi:hypothetical protein
VFVLVAVGVLVAGATVGASARRPHGVTADAAD